MSLDQQIETKSLPKKTLDNSTYIAKLDDYKSKHPLKDTWTFWYVTPSKSTTEWAELTKEIFTFDTLEEFWGLQAALPSVDSLVTDYMFFKKDIYPQWESPLNKKGGKWVVSLSRDDLGADVINKFWGRIMFSIIGNNFVNNEHINGFYISNKRSSMKVQVWTDAIDKDIILPIGEYMKELLINSEFGIHEESQMRKNESFNPTKFTNKNPLYLHKENDEQEKSQKKSNFKNTFPADQVKFTFNIHERKTEKHEKNDNSEISINLIDKQ
ncbi:uncharacterized protein HGUI_03721 [Hanseniaspora guilliermondii]|uniref:Eukaryotic translation initiation factor 4E n=1 Tax=Hanseniaspora guilliermondii TaxID=56406 RepID=A0A1L0B4R3_9ASCO|nr:uncharacterized protein HGUI_03721 [Hanseniaspora guilliermondii]